MILRKLIIKGNSMSPTLNSNDIIYASPLPYLFSNPQVNDIVLCFKPKSKSKIVKRIARIDNLKYYLLGDNKNESTDSRTFGTISKKDIIGKVVHISKRQSL